jgi:hypothetical protein
MTDLPTSNPLLQRLVSHALDLGVEGHTYNCCGVDMNDQGHHYYDPDDGCDCGWAALHREFVGGAGETSEKHRALAREIHARHERVSKLLWGPGSVPGMILGPMDADEAHKDRGRLLSLLTPEQRGDALPVEPRETSDLRDFARRVASHYDESYKPGCLERTLGDAARRALGSPVEPTVEVRAFGTSIDPIPEKASAPLGTCSRCDDGRRPCVCGVPMGRDEADDATEESMRDSER